MLLLTFSLRPFRDIRYPTRTEVYFLHPESPVGRKTDSFVYVQKCRNSSGVIVTIWGLCGYG